MTDNVFFTLLIRFTIKFVHQLVCILSILFFSFGLVSGGDTGRSGPVDQLHNIYIAAATLAGACLIVLAVVTVCHCRVHHSYRGCVRRLGRSCAQLKQHTLYVRRLPSRPFV